MRDELETLLTTIRRRLRIGTLDRPDRTLIVTGIPRSGTSLACSLLNQVPDVVCFNEIFYDVSRLPRELNAVRRSLVLGEPVPNKYDRSGRIASDTMDGAEVVYRALSPMNPELVVATNVNAPYLFRIRKLMALGCPIVAFVRDPVFTLASWGSARANTIPEAQVGPDPLPLHRRWRRLQFRGRSPVERRAEVWNFLAGILIEHRRHIEVIRYEDMVEKPRETLSGLLAGFGRECPSLATNGIRNGNMPSRFEGLEEIRDALHCYAPNRRYFAYE